MHRAYSAADLSAMADLTDELLALFHGRIADLREDYVESDAESLPKKEP